MQEFTDLRDRVEHTAHKLANLHVERQEQSQSLVGVLAELEAKYVTQEEQLAWYRNRVEPLEKSNEDLAVLLEHLLDLIDRGFGEASLDPVRSATALATTMLSEDMAVKATPAPVIEDEPVIEEETDIEMAEDTADPDLIESLQEEIEESIEEDEIVLIDPEEEEPEPEILFEDVPEETLALELVADDLVGSDDLPELVRAACKPAENDDEEEGLTVSDIMDDVAFSDLAAEVMAPKAEERPLALVVDEIDEEDEDLFQPEESTASEAEPSSSGPAKADIKALLERVQSLASKAEAMQGKQTTPDAVGLERIADAIEQTREKSVAVG